MVNVTTWSNKFGSKNFGSKIFGFKHFGSKKVGPKKNLGPINSGPKNLASKNLGIKIWLQNIQFQKFGPKNLGSQISVFTIRITPKTRTWAIPWHRDRKLLGELLFPEEKMFFSEFFWPRHNVFSLKVIFSSYFILWLLISLYILMGSVSYCPYEFCYLLAHRLAPKSISKRGVLEIY